MIGTCVYLDKCNLLCDSLENLLVQTMFILFCCGKASYHKVLRICLKYSLCSFLVVAMLSTLLMGCVLQQNTPSGKYNAQQMVQEVVECMLSYVLATPSDRVSQK